jgi:hypothetical protein
MFIINPTISLVAIAIVTGFYGLLMRRHLHSPFTDVRSGLFVAIAQWAAQKAAALPSQQQRAWKPNLLVPVTDPLRLRGELPFMQDLVNPTGYIDFMGLAAADKEARMGEALEEVSEQFRGDGVFSRWTVLATDQPTEALILGMQAQAGSFFRPNMVYLALPETPLEEENAVRVIEAAQKHNLGVVVVGMHPKVRMGSKRVVNLWVHPQQPGMELALRRSHLNLAILTAYTVARNWHAKINIVSSIDEELDVEHVRESLENLIDLARIPDPEIHLLEGDFRDNLGRAPRCDLDIMGLAKPPNFSAMREAVSATESSVIFVADSGLESAVA